MGSFNPQRLCFVHRATGPPVQSEAVSHEWVQWFPRFRKVPHTLPFEQSELVRQAPRNEPNGGSLSLWSASTTGSGAATVIVEASAR